MKHCNRHERSRRIRTAAHAVLLSHKCYRDAVVIVAHQINTLTHNPASTCTCTVPSGTVRTSGGGTRATKPHVELTLRNKNERNAFQKWSFCCATLCLCANKDYEFSDSMCSRGTI